MLISIDWIKDFVKLPELSPKKLGEDFTLSTAEVEGLSTSNAHLSNITVVEVLAKEKHPEADKLNLVSFTDGKTEKRVVCGAPNVKVGMKTAFAPIGTCFPNGLTLEPKKIRGVLSEGMLCSEEELGTSTESAGIIDLDSKTPLGAKIVDVLKLKVDTILDVDNKSLTHRPDLWGHFGIAREFAAIYSKDLKVKFSTSWVEKMKGHLSAEKSPIIPKVLGQNACSTYLGLSVNGVTIGESPEWMKQRLEAVGLRSINNIVDISNYVMLEYGHPLHIFDRDSISNKEIVIEALKEEEEFETLDEIKRTLVPGDTVIRDKEKTLVLAGIMGGLNSGVSEGTSKIFIEVANWVPSLVRSTSTRLGLRTDSSLRFEKSLDNYSCENVLLRTLELILDLCPKAKVIGKIESAMTVPEYKALSLTTNVKNINKTLGKELEESRIVSILESLDFKVSNNKGELKVLVPSYRATKDVEVEADLIEEIGRIVGYGEISPSSPLMTVSPVRLSNKSSVHRTVRNFLSLHSNSYEVFTYPMVGEKLLSKASIQGSGLDLINALSKDHCSMRPSLIPSLLEMVSLNAKNFSFFKAFEIGKVYSKGKDDFSEEVNQVALVNFSKSNNVFTEVLDDLEGLLSSLSCPFQLSEKNEKFPNSTVDYNWEGLHPYEFYTVRLMGKMRASIFTVHPLMLKKFKIKGNLTIALVDLRDIENVGIKDRVKYKPLDKHPSSSFDFTLQVDKPVAFASVLNVINKLKLKNMESCKLVDIYDLNESEKTLTLRSVFKSEGKTLGADELGELRDKLLGALDKAGFPLKKDK